MLNHLELNSILEDFDIAYWTIDPITQHVSWSPHFITLTGPPTEAAAHLEFFLDEILHKDFRYDFRVCLEELLKESKPFNLELRLRMQNGRYRWFECRSLKKKNEDEINAAVLLFINIHQAKRDEYTIEENFFYYRETAEMTSTGGWYADAVSGAVYWDDVTKRILHCPFDYQPSPQDKMKFYAPGHQEKAATMFKKCCDYGIPFKEELKMLTFHNREFWVRATGKPVYNSDQDVIGVRGVFQDIDVQKTNEINLQNSLDIIAAQNSRLFNMAHIISHDLRSHSSNLSLVSQLIAESKDVHEQLDLLGNISQIAEQLDVAIRQLNKTVTRQTTLAKQRKKVIFAEVLKAVTTSISSLINREKAQIIAEFDKLDEINYIPEYLESILLNLITNAIKFRHPGRKPVIYIQTSQDNGNQFLELSDNGMGIDLDQHGDKMFGMYETFHDHPEAKGIGLFITKNQVEVMGGNISVVSTLNIGTTFKIKF